jgi:glutamine amidotransferase
LRKAGIAFFVFALSDDSKQQQTVLCPFRRLQGAKPPAPDKHLIVQERQITMKQSKDKIVIIDFGMGNIRSVQKACAFLGCEGELIQEPEKLMTAAKAILPGVGAFGDAAAVLAERGFTEAIKEYAAQGRPLLGICLGMQLMFTGSTEGLETDGPAAPFKTAAPTPASLAPAAAPLAPASVSLAPAPTSLAPAPASLAPAAIPAMHKGLGFFPDIIRRFPADLAVKIPHIGWNMVECRPGSALFAGLPARFSAYFVHSYIAGDVQALYAAGLCHHGREFVAAVERDNLWATQFHPEKSGDLGLRILANFLKGGSPC